MDVGTYITKLKGIDLQQIIIDVFKTFELRIIRQNVIQLEKGFDSKGEPIGEYKNFSYAKKKYAQNSKAGFGNMDLILTGDFVAGIFIEFTSDSLIFDSKNKVKEGGEGGVDLLKNYGDDVLGLSNDGFENLKPKIQEELIKKIKEKLAA